MQFIDTHTHVTDEAFSGEEEAVIARAMEAGVTRMFQADIDRSERPAMLAAVDRHPGVLFPMAGLYPGSVKSDWKEELDAVAQALCRPDIIAVGEIGLDYHFSTEFAKEQKEAFRAQLEMAAAANLPVNIHLRDATDDFFRILDDCKGLGIRGNLHAFSGSIETFRRLRKYGDWSVGIGGVLTFKKASIARDLAEIPLECILLETDAPYLTPAPYRGQRNESSMIPVIAAKVAEIKGTDIGTVARTTTANAERLFLGIC